MIERISKYYLNPTLKALGFKKRNLVWNRARGVFVDVISLQKAKHSTGLTQSITGNVGVCIPEFYRAIFDSYPAFITEAECAVRVRFGELIVNDYSGISLDHWWDLTKQNVDIIGVELCNLLNNKAIHFLDSFSDFDSIERHLHQLRGWLSKDAYTQINKALVYWKLGNALKCDNILADINKWPEKIDKVRNWISQYSG